MKCKRFCSIILSTIILSQTSIYSSEIIQETKPGTAVFVKADEKKSSITIDTENIVDDTKNLKVDLNIPVISNLENKFFQKKLNYHIKNHQMCKMKCITKDSKKIPNAYYELISNYNVKSSNKILSLEVSIYDFRGGAHGLTTNHYYNIDTVKGELVCLGNMFDKSSNYIEEINMEIERQIVERGDNGESFFKGSDGFNSITNNQDFYINKEGDLVIVFGLYEIAPYSEGIVEFIIPKNIITLDYI